MADTKLRIDIATEFTGKKAFKQAEDSTVRLSRSVKKLAASFGVTFSAQQIIRFSKASVQAFAADDRAAQVLTRSLANLGLAFEDLNVKSFISELQKQTGVLDDQLRPAFQKLLTTTGSVAEAQKILRTALDLSAASGVDLETVSTDLSKAYVGQTRGLAKYGLGLSQAELKGMKYADVQERINKLFGGSAATVADSYAGKLARVNVQFKNFQEATGKALLDGLDNLSGQKGGGVSWLQARFDALSDSVSRTVDNFSRFAGAVGLGISGKGSAAYQLLNKEQIGSRSRTPADKNAVVPAIANELRTKAWEDRMKLLREEAKTQSKITDNQKKQLALEKAKAALAKAQANFDITKIQLAAALKGKISKEEETRLLALQAIENENGELALKYISELDYQRKLAAQAEEARLKALADAEMARQNALLAAVQARIDAVQAMIDKVQKKIEGNAAQALADIMAASAAAPSGVAGYSAIGSTLPQQLTNPYAGTYYGETGRDPMPVQVQVSLDGQVFSNAVVNAVNFASSSGTQLAYTQTAVR